MQVSAQLALATLHNSPEHERANSPVTAEWVRGPRH